MMMLTIRSIPLLRNARHNVFQSRRKRVVGRTETALDGIGLIHRPAKTHRQLTAVALDRTPHFDAAGRFIHPCSNCGREAVLGTHVNVLAGQLGCWYCGACKPL